MPVLILVIALIVILIGAELFTNGIEWVGRKLDLAEGAVGSVLAAVGTALPETMIPIIAILFAGGGEASHAVGIGAILGAPFMLSTLAMFVTGIGVLAFRGRRATAEDMRIDTPTLLHDVRYFAIAYAIAVGAAFLPLEPAWLKWIVAVGLVAIYAWYVKGHFAADAEVDPEDLAPLRFHRLDAGAHRADPQTPRLRIVYVQVAVALGCIVVGAFFFVDGVEQVAAVLGVDELLLALVVAPIATELPEKFNSLDLGAPEQGHARDGQHHRRDGLPVDHPDVRCARRRRRRRGYRRGLIHGFRIGGHCLPVDRGHLHPAGSTGLAARSKPVGRRCLLPRLSRARGLRHRGRLSPFWSIRGLRGSGLPW